MFILRNYIFITQEQMKTLTYLSKIVLYSNTKCYYLSIMVRYILSAFSRIKMGATCARNCLTTIKLMMTMVALNYLDICRRETVGTRRSGALAGMQALDTYSSRLQGPSITWQKLGNPTRNSNRIPPINSVQ